MIPSHIRIFEKQARNILTFNLQLNKDVERPVRQTEREKSQNGAIKKGGGILSYFQWSENNQDWHGNLTNRQGNHILKCISFELLFQMAMALSNVSDQEIISSKALVQKVILCVAIMAGQRKPFPSNGVSINQIKKQLRFSLLYDICSHHQLKYAYKSQTMSCTEFIQRDKDKSMHLCFCLCGLWALILSRLRWTVMMSLQTTVEQCPRTCAKMDVSGAFYYLSRELKTDWPEYLSYC